MLFGIGQNKYKGIIPQVVNPNLLDNPWFTINQRELTTYTGAVYGVDRWRSSNANGTLVVHDGYITVSASNSGNAYFRQYFKQNYRADIPYTLSIIVRGDADFQLTYSSTDTSVYSNLECSVHSNTWTLIQRTFIPQVDQVPLGQVYIRCDQGNTFDIRAIKLEIGTFSTLEYESTPNYAEELAKCQKYFVRWNWNNHAIVNGQYSSSGTRFYFTPPESVLLPHRIVASSSGSLVFRTIAGYATATGFTTADGGDISLLSAININANANYVYLTFADKAVNTNNTPGVMVFGSTNGAYFDFETTF